MEEDILLTSFSLSKFHSNLSPTAFCFSFLLSIKKENPAKLLFYMYIIEELPKAKM